MARPCRPWAPRPRSCLQGKASDATARPRPGSKPTSVGDALTLDPAVSTGAKGSSHLGRARWRQNFRTGPGRSLNRPAKRARRVPIRSRLRPNLNLNPNPNLNINTHPVQAVYNYYTSLVQTGKPAGLSQA